MKTIRIEESAENDPHLPDVATDPEDLKTSQQSNSSFPCHICRKSLKKKTYLAEHIRRHFGEKI